MLWKFLVTVVTILSRPFHSDVSPAPSYNEELAHRAFYEGEAKINDFPSYAVTNNNNTRWPGFPGGATVPYVIRPELSQITDLIEEAMEQYHKNTCVRFVKRTNERDYLDIQKDQGCYSYVGKYHGPQPVSLGDGCHIVGTIVHELGHAIGCYHEHNRSDRDKYLIIYEQNIQNDRKDQFNKTEASEEMITTPYNPKSIMHYGNYAFSIDPRRLKSMEAKDGTPLLEPYQKPGLVDTDIQMVKDMYAC
ncbi:astacin-like metalloprotease toxin 1 [Trichonephila inaurata madagascariensis]|uniref:Metalloendopeptidase n=1 Tax=Trichonephila inaurata madagascariensis TaxID=2747483 RepID=A0A8X6YF92_9ARAC|nr:astacin-like metalloprotease toxin 1 [Trichonephila inaurata madagascariensis]